ncbi:hypothetical protein SynA1825c_02536 [Synechococcus sp. A18-25c]|uniref:putative sugar O-methyltransferase n=1 Tax=Synechococcus sp. A18-25c TaxID=1866938 RepID=UPI0016471CAC|nr:putative sugar O-methyltransferase [Synechococcus sp. A18-25c]QNJ20821.1 hypothetical protein SynA1825c_02536 [Synechococcus sp. A18-25c]
MNSNSIDQIIKYIVNKNNSVQEYGFLWNNADFVIAKLPELVKSTLPIFSSLPIHGGFLESWDQNTLQFSGLIFRILLGQEATKSQFLQSIKNLSEFDPSFTEELALIDRVNTYCPDFWDYLVPFTSIGAIPHFNCQMPATGQDVVASWGSVKSAVMTSNLIKKNALDLKMNTINILEIGAGYGNLCQTITNTLLKKEIKINYIIVDIPSSLVVSCFYLESLLPDVNCVFVDSSEKLKKQAIEYKNSSTSSILLVPSDKFKLLNDYPEPISLTINSESFLEMSPKYLNEYLDLIFKTIQPECFYSRNRRFRSERDGSKRTIDEIKIPDQGWDVIKNDEECILDQSHVRKLVQMGSHSSIVEVYGFKR